MPRLFRAVELLRSLEKLWPLQRVRGAVLECVRHCRVQVALRHRHAERLGRLFGSSHPSHHAAIAATDAWPHAQLAGNRAGLRGRHGPLLPGFASQGGVLRGAVALVVTLRLR